MEDDKDKIAAPGEEAEDDGTPLTDAEKGAIWRYLQRAALAIKERKALPQRGERVEYGEQLDEGLLKLTVEVIRPPKEWLAQKRAAKKAAGGAEIDQFVTGSYINENVEIEPATGKGKTVEPQPFTEDLPVTEVARKQLEANAAKAETGTDKPTGNLETPDSQPKPESSVGTPLNSKDYGTDVINAEKAKMAQEATSSGSSSSTNSSEPQTSEGAAQEATGNQAKKVSKK
jgi:hypothetical protein